MGRITIFSSTGNRACDKIKGMLKLLGIPFQEINLTDYPQRRKDMLSLTSKMETPQVFLNAALVGGVDEAVKVLSQWSVDQYEDFCGSAPVSTIE
jgi:glutaredoxin